MDQKRNPVTDAEEKEADKRQKHSGLRFALALMPFLQKRHRSRKGNPKTAAEQGEKIEDKEQNRSIEQGSKAEGKVHQPPRHVFHDEVQHEKDHLPKEISAHNAQYQDKSKEAEKFNGNNFSYMLLLQAQNAIKRKLLISFLQHEIDCILDKNKGENAKKNRTDLDKKGQVPMTGFNIMISQ